MPELNDRVVESAGAALARIERCLDECALTHVEAPDDWHSYSNRLKLLSGAARRVFERGEGRAELRAFLPHPRKADPSINGPNNTTGATGRAVVEPFLGDQPTPEPGGWEDPCSFSTFGELTSIGLGAVFAGESREDRSTMLREVVTLFEEGVWLERANSAARRSDPDQAGLQVGAIIDMWGANTWSEPGGPADGPLGGPGDPSPEPFPTLPPSDPFDRCELRRRLCLGDIIELLEELNDYLASPEPANPIAFADNIDSITASGCAGDPLLIVGHDFGDVQPSNIRLLLPDGTGACRTVTVPRADWSDSQIVITIPDWARGGCVGFFDDDALAEWNTYWDGIESRVNDLNSVGIECQPLGYAPGFASTPPRLVPRCPPCTGSNRFDGTVPEIKTFTADGRAEPWRIGPRALVRLDWKVDNVQRLTIERLPAGVGPDFNLPAANGARRTLTGSTNLRFASPSDGLATYRLTAKNQCGVVTADLTLTVRAQVDLTLEGLEVVQSVQTYEPNNPVASNRLPLVERKRTMVRIYVAADFGPALSAIGYNGGRLGSMTASARVVQLSNRGRSFQWVSVIPPNSGAPPNHAGAPEPGSVDRTQLVDTLNVEVPWTQLEGKVRIEVEVTSTDTDARWSRLHDSVKVDLYPSPNLDLVLLEVIDNFRANRGPTAQERLDGLNEIRAVYPVAEDQVRLFNPGYTLVQTNWDYDESAWWRDYVPFTDSLLGLIEDIAEDFGDDGEIWCGIVPAAAVTGNQDINGSAIAGNVFSYSKAAWLALSNMTAAHEVGHAVGYGHTDRSTDEVGVDVPRQVVLPRGSPFMMNPGVANRWVDGQFLIRMLARLSGREVLERLVADGHLPAAVLHNNDWPWL